MCDSVSVVDYENGKLFLSSDQSIKIIDEIINKETEQHFVYGRIFKNNQPTDQYLINPIVGILHLSSKRIYSTDRKTMTRKEFTPFNRHLPPMLVKTKKVDLSEDEFAIVKPEYFDGKFLIGSVLEYIGCVLDPKNDIKLIKSMATCHWKKKWDKEFLSLVDTDLTPDRLDLTDLEIYSIDPINCVDMDDALHFRKMENSIEIGIHIADVSSYIEEKSNFDIELSKRVQTSYFNHMCMEPIHMIPPELSINHISLKQGEIKRSFSIIIQINSENSIVEVKFVKVNFVKSLIKVRQNMSYEYAQRCISEQDHFFNEDIRNLYELGIVLKEKIFKKAFDPQVVYDTHQMVAVYMLLANKLVAEKIKDYDSDLVLLRNTTEHYIDHTYEDYSDLDIDSKLLEKYKLSFSERARYQIGINKSHHHGLDLDFYTHFTSPMRRYADIVVHRQLWKVLKNLPLTIVDPIMLFDMNYYSKHYRIVERYSHIVDIANKYFEDCQMHETEAYITFISNLEENNLGFIKLYVPIWELDLGIYLCNSEFQHLIEFKISVDKIRKIMIRNLQNNSEIQLELFQKIKIKISMIRKSIDKICVSIIEPQLFDII